jgi:hypothetical protein
VGRHPQLIVAYFECEGISGCHIDKQGDAIVPEGVEQSALQKLLHAFIQQHVLCRRCRNPETTVVGLDDEHHTTILRCLACGAEAGSADQASPLFYQWLKQPDHKQHWALAVSDEDKIRRLQPNIFDPVTPPVPSSDDYVSSGGWYVSPRAAAAEPSD